MYDITLFSILIIILALTSINSIIVILTLLLYFIILKLEEIKPNKIEKELLEKVLPVLEEGNSVRTLSFNDEEAKLLKGFQLLTIKPVLYVANVGENGFSDNPHLDAVIKFAESENSEAIAICADIEAEISELEDADDKALFMEEYQMKEPALNRLIQTAYKLLKLETYFTAGVQEVRAWTIGSGWKAPQAASVIHTDFEKGFIKAEVIAFDDYIKFKSEAACRDNGKLRIEGKEYIVKDGDVMHFRFNV